MILLGGRNCYFQKVVTINFPKESNDDILFGMSNVITFEGEEEGSNYDI